MTHATDQTHLADLASRITPPDRDASDAARARWDTRAKPPGSLGRVEDIGVRIAGITGRVPPALIERPEVIVFAGDHGVVADGASAWPSEVTAFMVGGMAAGGAAINAFATTVGARVTLVDVGVAADLGSVPGVIDRKVRPGTASLHTGPAMTRPDALAALRAGAEIAQSRVAAGADLLVGGDMGIGNTTPSVALIATRLVHERGSPDVGALVAGLVGPGAGLPAEGMPTKVAIVRGAVERALALPDADAVDVLAETGGLEIAALAGLMLAGAAARVPVVVDGVIACAAACTADAIAPGVARLLLAGHRSTEPAATAALDLLGLDPILDLDLRLGEGTGACLAIPIVQAAVRALHDMGDLPA